MQTRSCPSCGAPVEFRSAAPFAVCSYCRSMLIRRDVTLESIGRVAEVPDDFSPLQLGVKGIFDGHRFSLVGRQRKVWDQGSWNEWCASFDDKRLGWLAEAQGELVMTFERSLDSLTPRPQHGLSRIGLGNEFTIDGSRFEVADVKEVECIGAEGELISLPAAGVQMTSMDLRGSGVEFATLEGRENEVSVFVGRFVEFAECRFSGLRKLAGWTRADSGES